MKIKLPKTLKNKKYPVFIRENTEIKKYPIVIKRFKENGLRDFRISYKHKSDITLTKYVRMLKEGLTSYLNELIKINYFPDEVLISLESKLLTLARKITISSIKKNRELVLPGSVRIYSFYRQRSVTYNKGTSILNLLNSFCRDLKMFNINNDKYRMLLDLGIGLELSWHESLKIVFSTHSWDIATMSMRGVGSCQSWGKAESRSLVGSILDPNAALIYMTDGSIFKTYGERIIARSVVRLVIPTKNELTRNERLFLENSYSYFSRFAVQSDLLYKIFRASLDKKITNSNKLVLNKNKIYGIKRSVEIKNLSEEYLSYRDSDLSYI